MTKRARRKRPNKIIMMRSRHDEDEDEDDGYDNPSPWKRPRLMRPLKALLLVSALYFATARNDEVQFQDDKGAGELFIGRLLSSTHEMRIVHALRVNVHVFGILKESLGEMLAPVREVPNAMGADEKLAIALQWMGHGTVLRTQMETFQRSTASCMRARHEVIAAIICCLYAKYVRLIRKSVAFAKLLKDKFKPFLGAHGAIDGTHIALQVAAASKGRFFGHKKEPTMNIMFVCDFNHLITWCMSGTEGTVNDSEIYTKFWKKLCLPVGSFWLGDAGFGLR
jgi:hypothetical protein